MCILNFYWGFIFICELRNRLIGRPSYPPVFTVLSTMQIRLHAKEFAKEIKIEDFDGGQSCCVRFMK